MFLKDKFEDYYEVYFDEKTKLLCVRDKTSLETVRVLDNNNIYLFTFGKKTCMGEVNESLQRGEAMSITGHDLYSNYLKQEQIEESLMHVYNIDTRTKEYFNKVKREIGLNSVKQGDKEYAVDGTDFITKYDLDILGNPSLKQFNQHYLVEIHPQKPISDFKVITFFFNHLPSEDEFIEAFFINKIETLFFTKNLNVIFKCKRCGKMVHWLDNPGGITEKFTKLENKRCC